MIDVEYVRSLEEDIRLSDEAETQHKEQIRTLETQIGMLEAEVDRQSTIIDALVKAIRVIERG
jgi:hypothetical protein